MPDHPARELFGDADECEICGKPSECAVRDMSRKMCLRSGIYYYEPFGEPHCFCLEHSRDAKIIDPTTRGPEYT